MPLLQRLLCWTTQGLVPTGTIALCGAYYMTGISTFKDCVWSFELFERWAQEVASSDLCAPLYSLDWQFSVEPSFFNDEVFTNEQLLGDLDVVRVGDFWLPST